MFGYTSGTTGDPKGAKLAHSCFVAIGQIVDYLKIPLNENDISLSYLPYAHCFE